MILSLIPAVKEPVAPCDVPCCRCARSMMQHMRAHMHACSNEHERSAVKSCGSSVQQVLASWRGHAHGDGRMHVRVSGCLSAHACVCMRAHAHAWVKIRECVRAHAYACACNLVHVHAYSHVHVRVYLRACARAHAYMLQCMCMCVCAHVRVRVPADLPRERAQAERRRRRRQSGARQRCQPSARLP